MKKILVTGGSGFLGSYVVKELSKDSHHNISILTKNKNKISSQFKLIIADITNKEEIIRNVKNFDTVYHVAGNIITPETDIRKLHFAINSDGTRNILEACRINNIQRVIYISTSEVYGDKNKEQIGEDEKKNPSNNYARSKLLAEKYCNEYAHKHNMTITVLRPSYIYGYGQYEGRLFPRLIDDSLKNKRTRLKPYPGGSDFVYVKDVAAGIVLLGEHEQHNNFDDYNISSGRFTTVKEVFEVVKKLTGCEYDANEIIDKTVNKFSLNIEKAKIIGYKPLFDLKKGLIDYIEYIQRPF